MASKRKKKKDLENFSEEKEKNISPATERWLLTITLWGSAIFILLSLFGQANIVGEKLNQILLLVMGWGRFIVPLALLFSGYWILRQEKLTHPYYRINGVFLALISALGISSLLANGQQVKLNAKIMVTEGGYIGLALAYSAKYLGFWGGLAVLVTLFLSGLVLLLDGYFDKKEDDDQTEENSQLTIENPVGENKESLAAITFFQKIKEKIQARKKEKALKDLASDKNSASESNTATKTNESNSDGSSVNGLQSTPTKNNFSLFKRESRNQGDKSQSDKINPSELKNKTTAGAKENWVLPALTILEKNTTKAVAEDIKVNSAAIKKTLINFGIPAEVVEVNVGPTVTQFALRPAEGIKLSRITAIQSNLAMSLAAHPIRIEAPIPGRSLVGVEVPNKVKRMVSLRDLLEDSTFKEASENLLVALGEDPAGNYVYADLAEMPHLLIAGATGSGKSIGVNCLITSLLYRNSPQKLKLIMVDPKRVELSVFNNIPHLLTPVIVDYHKAVNALKWAVSEMERRYIVIQETMSRNIISYNQKVLEGEIEPEINKTTGEILEPEFLPYIVILVDELADLMSSPYAKELEATIVRLAQMSRAVGIHLVLSTQRPSVNVITGVIKANFPTRIAFQVVSQIDSRTILDMAGAEKLLGKGDMLYLPKEFNQPRRIQGTYVSEKEIQKVVNHLIEQEVANYNPTILQTTASDKGEIIEENGEEELYEEAKQIVIREGKASTSLLQRHLRIGYSRAARIIDLLEKNGIIGPAEGSKPRQILASGNNVENPALESSDSSLNREHDFQHQSSPMEEQAERDKWKN